MKKIEKFITFITDFIFLVSYYRTKKKEFVCDVFYESWNTLKRNEVEGYKVYIPLKNGSVGRFELIKIDSMGYIPKGLYFDLEFIDDLPYIRHCTFWEFYKLYKDVILFLANEEEVVDHGNKIN